MRADTVEQLRSVLASPLRPRRAVAQQCSTAEELLSAAAADMGKAANDTAPFIHKLVHEQWYDTAGSLQSIGEDLWMRLGIPLNLFGLYIAGCRSNALEEMILRALSA